jgi:hypothetical protein
LTITEKRPSILMTGHATTPKQRLIAARVDTIRRRVKRISRTVTNLQASNHAAEAARLHTRHFGQK